MTRRDGWAIRRTAMASTFQLHALRAGILAYFAGLFALALFTAWSVLAATATNPECAIRDCRRYERAGDWMAALSGEALFAAGLSLTGVVVLGTALFALPWLVYLRVLKKRGVVK